MNTQWISTTKKIHDKSCIKNRLTGEVIVKGTHGYIYEEDQKLYVALTCSQKLNRYAKHLGMKFKPGDEYQFEVPNTKESFDLWAKRAGRTNQNKQLESANNGSF